MRIAYVVYWDLAAGDGVARKIDSQLRLWREFGHEVEAFAIAPGPLGERLRRTRAAVSALDSYRPDIVYLRYDLYLPPVWRLTRRYRVVLELNGDERAEYALRGRSAAVLAALNRRFLLARAAGFVPVTEEIGRTVQALGKPVAVVANGADPDAVPWTPAPDHERPRAVFAGSPDLVWHGVDRLLAIAEALPWLDVDLIGPTPLAAPSNVSVHGRLEGADYFRLLGAADVAFGSLAMERAGLREGSPLKVREYLLAGLPVVVGYEDTDFLGEDPWFLLRSVDPGAIGEFVRRVKGRRVQRDEVEQRVSSRAKEEARQRFLMEIAV